jgi:four helix bundle protein
MNNYKELKVWQKSVDLSIEIYKLTKEFPGSEQFGLTSQIRRASVSIAANIAEGAGRNSQKEFVHFLGVAIGSAYEQETHLIISEKLGFLPGENTFVFNQIIEIEKMIRSLIKSKS